MNEAPQLEIVELGDAKEETKGVGPVGTEEDPSLPYQKTI